MDINNPIWNSVESLRAQHAALQSSQLPLDLITFVDLDLELDLIPYEGLSKKYGADAAVLSDFSGFYIDRETFDLIDSAPEWKLNRLRFSLAHELGHWNLHQGIFSQAAISSDSHLLNWLNHHNGQKYQLEREANEFAGRLIIPIDILTDSFNKIADAFDAALGRHAWFNDNQLRQKACEQIASRFGVHHQAIATRFDREGLWPSIY